ncbi:ABC transporter permease [Candidatus Poribacteria bacterium]|nr:ABC transporter permease [Candidatus Poribacteria bacterium]
MEYTLTHTEYEALKPYLRANPHIQKVTSQLDFSGLINRAEQNVSFLGLGVEVELDPDFSTQISIVEGEGLSTEHPEGVILGKGLAEKIEAHPGDNVILLANTKDGVLNAVDVTIRGTFEGGMKAYDDWVMKVPMAKAQQLMYFDDIHRVVLLLDKTENTDGVKAQLLHLFDQANLPFEIETWYNLALFHNQVVALFSRELDVIKVIISTIVILSIINTMSMSIFERTKEIGTMMSMGAKRWQVMRLFLMEALILGIIGGVLGVLGGIGLAQIISAVGIQFPSPPGATRPFSGKVAIVPSTLLKEMCCGILMTAACCYLPKARTKRRRIFLLFSG